MKRVGWLITGILVIALIIGGIFYMKRQNDKQELLDTQKDIANYVYNNYSAWTEDKAKVKILDKEYLDENGKIKEGLIDEYFDKIDELKEYTEITSIKFTSA